MSVLIEQKKELTRDTGLSSIWGSGNKVRERIASLAVQDKCTRPQIRMEKVLAIRQQLAEGKYDLDQRLDAVLDKLLETLNA
jgi:anti-sigma28 factor (negative regulator of flagellin synthesis)